MVTHDAQLSRVRPAHRRPAGCAADEDVMAMGIVRRLAIGIGSLAALALLVVGVPALLLVVGFTPARAGISSWPDLVVRLQMPDDGTLIGLILTAVAWLAWLYMVAAIVTEASAALRRVPAVRLPVLSLGQIPAKKLVAGVALLFIATPLLASAVPGPPAYATPTPAPPAADRVAQEVATQDVPGSRTVTVKRGDSLSKIAREHLGDGGRWDEIYEASKKIEQPGGRRLSDPDQIDIGWTLSIPGGTTPTDQSNGTDQATAVVVKRGDSLSKLAREHLGDPGRWDEIFQASTGIKQADGRHLSNPDHIEPGWVLHLPATEHDQAPTHDDSAPPADQTPTPQESPDGTATPDPTPAATATAVEPAPPTPASTPTQVRTPPAEGVQAEPTPAANPTVTPAEDDELETPSWLLPGLTGAGSLLAGSLWLLLGRRRAVQFRARRPGRTIATPPTEHVDVEKTLMHAGGPTGDVIIQVDQGLRRLAATITAAGQPLPALLGVDVTPAAVAVVFTDTVDLPGPWQSSGDHTSWWIGLDELNCTDEAPGRAAPAATVAPVTPATAITPAPSAAVAPAGDDRPRRRWNLAAAEPGDARHRQPDRRRCPGGRPGPVPGHRTCHRPMGPRCHHRLRRDHDRVARTEPGPADVPRHRLLGCRRRGYSRSQDFGTSRCCPSWQSRDRTGAVERA